MLIFFNSNLYWYFNASSTLSYKDINFSNFIDEIRRGYGNNDEVLNNSCGSINPACSFTNDCLGCKWGYFASFILYILKNAFYSLWISLKDNS